MKMCSITIENLRGIKHKLVLPFVNGKTPTSLIIYGKNGTGKSSIVDAWEWMYSNKIQHLAREGSGERDYPHKNIDDNDSSYIEIVFDDARTYRLEYNNSKITKPIIKGSWSALSDIIPYPCHLRYSDLQQFVYKTKAEKYEYLATYLGYEDALRIQEQLKKYASELTSKIEHENIKITSDKSKLSKILDINDELTEENVMKYINSICNKYKIPNKTDIHSSHQILTEMKSRIDNNPINIEISLWKDIEKQLQDIYSIKNIIVDVDNLNAIFKEIEAKNNKNDTLRLDLYGNALEIMKNNHAKSTCPLCDQNYEGDLVEYINSKRKILESIKKNIDMFRKQEKNLKASISELQHCISNMLKIMQDVSIKEIHMLFETIENLNRKLPDFLTKLEKTVDKFEEIHDDDTIFFISNLTDGRDVFLKFISTNIDRLSKDTFIDTLMTDFSNTRKLLEDYEVYLHDINRNSVLVETFEVLNDMINSYSEWLQHRIEKTFKDISSNIIEFFNILEDNHQYIKEPKIILLEDKNKAVELEIEFAGTTLSPAYRVLSESQVNSFGLAIFLAAIKLFNHELRFIILDDIVNSFDAFKRPRVIDLLKQHFADYQFLILTHDSIWKEYIYKSFPKWNKMKFYGWEYENGPRVEVDRGILESIEIHLNSDNGKEAGYLLGLYLEWTLQLLNQNIQSQIHFKINNEYTLSELLDSFIARINKNVDKSNLLCLKLKEYDVTFRNYCDHWKDTEYTSDEIRVIFNKWKTIENMVFCDKCNSYVYIDRRMNNIHCKCNSLHL